MGRKSLKAMEVKAPGLPKESFEVPVPEYFHLEKIDGGAVGDKRSINRQICKIAIPTQDGLLFVKLDEIIYCRAVTNYTKFKLTDDRTIVSSYTLRHYEKVLVFHNFFRIHKSYLINLRHMTYYMRKGIATMSDGSEIDVSRTYKSTLLKHFQTNFAL